MKNVKKTLRGSIPVWAILAVCFFVGLLTILIFPTYGDRIPQYMIQSYKAIKLCALNENDCIDDAANGILLYKENGRSNAYLMIVEDGEIKDQFYIVHHQNANKTADSYDLTSSSSVFLGNTKDDTVATITFGNNRHTDIQKGAELVHSETQNAIVAGSKPLSGCLIEIDEDTCFYNAGKGFLGIGLTKTTNEARVGDLPDWIEPTSSATLKFQIVFGWILYVSLGLVVVFLICWFLSSPVRERNNDES